MGFKEEVHLSYLHTQWAASQPDAVLSPIEGFREIDKGDWNSGHASYIQDPWQSIVIKKEMTRFLETLAASVDDELRYAIPEYVKPDGKGEVDVYETMKWIVAQVSSRFTVGLPLCRNKEYLQDSLAFADLFILNSGLLVYTPSLLKPIMGFLLTLPTRYRRWKVQKHIAPLYEQRTRAILYPDSQPEGLEEPVDNLQMMIKYAVKNHKDRLSIGQISDRLCLANLASFHQTAVAMSNVLINIAASDAEFNTIKIIREEMAEALGESGGVFNKASVSKMVHTDSILKESMRTHAFGNRAMIRKVVARDGLATPDGHVLPFGSTLSIISYPVHHDVGIYEDPEKFYPFRFSPRPPGNSEGSDNPTQIGRDRDSKAPSSFVSTSPTYLPFGHGKHACPGRFLVDFELKMILHHILDAFDVELLPEQGGKRPDSKWVTEAVMPPVGVKLRFSKRDVNQE